MQGRRGTGPRRLVVAPWAVAAAIAIAPVTPVTPIASARGQDIRTPIPAEMAGAVAEALAASPDQRARIAALIDAWHAAHASELSGLVDGVATLLFTDDGPGVPSTTAGRLRAAERLAARQRARALALEQTFRSEVSAILTGAQQPRLDRVMRAWQRTHRGSPGVHVPPGGVDPIEAVHRVLRAEAGAAVAGSRPDEPFVPELPPPLRPHAGWLAEMELAYLERVARARTARRLAREATGAAIDRMLATRDPWGAGDGVDADELALVHGRLMRPAMIELAEVVAAFAREAEQRLPAPYGPAIAEEIRTEGYGVLHRDPTAPFTAAAAIAAEPHVDGATRAAISAAIETARREHEALTARLRATERRRAGLAMAADPRREADLRAATVAIAELLARRAAVNERLRGQVRGLVDRRTLLRHPWPPASDHRLQALIARAEPPDPRPEDDRAPGIRP